MQKDSDALKLARYKEMQEKLLTKENVTPNRSSVNACKAPYWRCLIQFLDGIFNTNTTARQISMHLANAFDERKRNSASTFVIKDYIMNQYKKTQCVLIPVLTCTNAKFQSAMS